MEFGALSTAFAEDLSYLVRYTSAIGSLKNQMMAEAESIRNQLENNEIANKDYVKGVHDAYVSLIQAISVLDAANPTTNQLPDPATAEE